MEFFEVLLKNGVSVEYYGNLYWVENPVMIIKRDSSPISKIGEKIIADVKARYGYEVLGNNHCFLITSKEGNSFSMVFTEEELIIGNGIISKAVAEQRGNF